MGLQLARMHFRALWGTQLQARHTPPRRLAALCCPDNRQLTFLCHLSNTVLLALLRCLHTTAHGGARVLRRLHTHVLLLADERWGPLVVAAVHTPPGGGCPAAQLACCPRVGMSRRRTALPRLVSRQERPFSLRQETEGLVQ